MTPKEKEYKEVIRDLIHIYVINLDDDGNILTPLNEILPVLTRAAATQKL